MSTKKSVLDWEKVVDQLPSKVPRSRYLHIPSGFKDEMVRFISLHSKDEYARLALMGNTGSGKNNALAFILNAFEYMYGANLTISYADGKDIEIKKWYRNGVCRFSSTGVMRSVPTHDDFTKFLQEYLMHMVDIENEHEHMEVLVLDDVTHLFDVMDDRDEMLLDCILRNAHKNNIFVILCTQTPTSKIVDRLNVRQWKLRMATHLHPDVSKALLGTDAASKTAKYGQVVIKYDDCDETLDMPYVAPYNLKRGVDDVDA